jgi:hypothetical protein
LQPLRDLVAHRIRPRQDRIDCVPQRAKLSSVQRSSPFSLQIGRDHRLVKFCGSRLEVEDELWVEPRRIHARGRRGHPPPTAPAPRGRWPPSTWMKDWPRSLCVGRRAAPLGDGEAMARRWRHRPNDTTRFAGTPRSDCLRAFREADPRSRLMNERKRPKGSFGHSDGDP